jgi:acyl-coenzyme A thioesterase PaaI-like protein
MADDPALLHNEDDLHQQEHEDEGIALETHRKIDHRYSGYINDLSENFAEVYLEIIEEMVVDDHGLVHDGFLFSAASFAAVSAVNEEFGIVIGAQSHFFSPVRVNDVVIFEAKSRQKDGKKRIVDVSGRVLDIKVFTGEFSVIIPDKHILSIKLTNLQVSDAKDAEKNENENT